LSAAFKCPQIALLWRLLHWSYSSPTSLAMYGQARKCVAVLSSEEGVRQGDPLAALLFALSMQRHYEICVDKRPEVLAVAVLDDLTLVGPPSSVFASFDALQHSIQSEDGGLELSLQKFHVLWQWDTPRPPDLAVECSCRGLTLAVGRTMKLLGGLIGRGDDEFTRFTEEVVASHGRLFELITHPELNPLFGAQILRVCVLPRVGHIMRIIDPRIARPALEDFDRQVLECFTSISHIEPLPGASC